MAPITIHSANVTANNIRITPLSDTVSEEASNSMSIGEPTKGEVFPTIPVHGAYIRIIGDGTLDRFGEWVNKTSAKNQTGTKTLSIEEFEVLTPAVYGMAYDRAVSIPPASRAGELVEITSWRGINCIVRKESRTVDEWRANHVAVPAPPLHPETESMKDKVARLEREKAKIMRSIHERMVAEGVARSWCSEFDPILDSSGLMPRHKDNVITGTMEFTFALSRDYGEASKMLDQIKGNWSSYIPTRELRVVDVRVVEDEVGPILST